MNEKNSEEATRFVSAEARKDAAAGGADTPPPEAPAPPAREEEDALCHIPGYEILGKLGEGAMGAVYKARQISLDRIVAMKTLPPLLAANPSFIDRFENEAKVAAKLKHPNIVQIHEAGHCESAYFFVMEYVSGESIGAMLRKQGSFPEPVVVRVASAVANALDHAWKRAQIIHRDIKPDNILVDEDGTIKVADLGLAKMVGNEDWNQTMSGMMMGTPQYCSPEQVSGHKEIDCRTDIYSLGATLYHMITGRVPFPATGGVAAMLKHITEYIEDPIEINPRISANTAWLIEKMMVKDPERRYSDWEAALADIAQVLVGEMPGGNLPEPGESTVKRSPTRTAAPAGRQTRAARRAIRRGHTITHKIDRAKLAAASQTAARAAPGPRRRHFMAAFGIGLALGAVLIVGARVWQRLTMIELQPYVRRTMERLGIGAPDDEAPVSPEDAGRIAAWPDYAALAQDMLGFVQKRQYAEALNRLAEWETAHPEHPFSREVADDKARIGKVAEVWRLCEPRLPPGFQPEAGTSVFDSAEPDVGQILRDAAPDDAAWNEAVILLAERRFERAAEQIAELKRGGRDTAELEAWLQAWQAEETVLAVEDQLRRIRELIAKKEFQQARDRLTSLWKEHGAAEVLSKFRKGEAAGLAKAINTGIAEQAALAQQKERRARIEKAVAEAEAAYKADQYWEAIEAAQQAVALGYAGPRMAEIIAACKGILASRPLFPLGQDTAMLLEEGDTLTRQIELVWLKALKMWVGKYEVTNREYRQFDPGHTPHFDIGQIDKDEQPAVVVQWKDALRYCEWLNKKYARDLPRGYVFRLPTEPEWEVLARCGDPDRIYPWGNDWPPPNDWNYFGEEWGEVEHRIAGHNDEFRVGAPVRQSGRNDWGLYGVGGNVWELCQNIENPKDPQPVLRGGSWQYGISEATLRIARRITASPDAKHANVGFRLVVGPEISPTVETRWSNRDDNQGDPIKGFLEMRDK
ncbi:MAG: protein kinase [Kiritimatiellae bacterium]|nr:protein kinase [Kiritimatiellia bacterium]